MGNNLSQGQKGICHSIFYGAMGFLFLTACATPLTKEPKPEEPKISLIEVIDVKSSADQTVVEIISSKAVPFTTFTFMDPPRIVLDIRGLPSENLPKTKEVNDGNVKEIRLEGGKTQSMTTRLTVFLSRALDHDVSEWNNVITLTLTPKDAAREIAQMTEPESTKEIPEKPRVFFKPRPTGDNEILGVDFSMLPRGKSKLTVTTTRKARYHLDRTGARELRLTIEKATIRPLLMRRLDSTYFEGTVDRVKASYSSADKRSSFAITLREMVPFHIKQTENTIVMVFARTSKSPQDVKLFPVKVSEEGEAKPPLPVPAPTEAPPPTLVSKGPGPTEAPAAVGIPGLKQGTFYTGSPMTMDFVNAEITNILRLVAEVSNLNIIWGPNVRGTVSMRLKNVPWDQALDLVLTNNKLAQRKIGNVIWITTKADMAQLEAEEKQKGREQEESKRKEQEERLAQQKREPKETRYITINYKDVTDIERLINDTVKSEEGKLTVDRSTKTIILRDTVSKVKEALELVKRLDKPVPQVMIEARIVEATLSFSQSLGVQWNYELQRRNEIAVPWNGTPAWASQNAARDFPSGGNLYTPTFQTNIPQGFVPNFGLLFHKLGSFGLYGNTINAQLALAESEGQATTLSAPRIVTRDTVTAVIKQGSTIVIPSGTDANGNATFTQVDASLKLEVTPTITPNNMVILKVSVSDDAPDFANAQQGQIPIRTKNATTEMMVKSGETVIIGGIYRDDSSDNTESIPYLSKIPFLGWLFRANRKTSTKTELLIFLTPTVLPEII